MPNTSATGGYLLPGGPALPEDSDLDAILQRAIVGVTGLPGDMVRPRWQPVTPKQPEPAVNWCAFGVNRRTVQDGPYIRHIDTGNGTDELSRHEDIVLLCTFYGPASQKFAMLLRDGLYIPQNMEALKADGVSFIDCGDLVAVPELYNQQWVRRFDLSATFRRKVSRTYQVQNIIAADIALNNDTGAVNEFFTVPPAPSINLGAN